MIKLVSIDRFTKRMFHHAPVSKDFRHRQIVRDIRYGIPTLDTYHLRWSVMPQVTFTSISQGAWGCVLRGRLHILYDSPIVPGRVFVFDQTLDARYDDSLRVSGMVQEVKRALAEDLADQYRQTIVALRAVASFRQHNVSNWRNMA